jgi:hypothetical protein
MSTHMVTWRNSRGTDYTTRVFTSELRDFAADVASVGGTVLEMRQEDAA